MTLFRVETTSSATVQADRGDVWAVLTDPELLAGLTPLLRRIEADGDTWRWHLQRIPVLTLAVEPRFTESMVFTPQERIEFAHTPPQGQVERAGVDGLYTLTDAGEATELQIRLDVHVDLPLPRLSGLAVRTAMRGVIAAMGSGFAANLVAHLDAR